MAFLYNYLFFYLSHNLFLNFYLNCLWFLTVTMINLRNSLLSDNFYLNRNFSILKNNLFFIKITNFSLLNIMRNFLFNNFISWFFLNNRNICRNLYHFSDLVCQIFRTFNFFVNLYNLVPHLWNIFCVFNLYLLITEHFFCYFNQSFIGLLNCNFNLCGNLSDCFILNNSLDNLICCDELSIRDLFSFFFFSEDFLS